MKRFLALFLILIMCMSASSAVYADEDDGDVEETAAYEDMSEDTSEDISEDTSEASDTSDTSDTSDSSESVTTDTETTTDDKNSEVQVVPPEGDGAEYETADFTEDTTVTVIGQAVERSAEEGIEAGILPENSGDHIYVNGVCTDCSAINNGFAYVNGIWGYFYDGSLQTGTTDFVYGTAGGVEGWYYVDNGKLNLDYKGVKEGSINGENALWYVENGKACVYTGAVRNGDEILVCENGRVNSDYTGVTVYDNTKWYAEDGVVRTDFSGIAKTSSGWWYVSEGRIDERQTKVVEYDGSSYYVRGGKVDFTYTGAAKNEYGTYRIIGGEWDPDYTNNIALAEDGKIYYMENGTAQFGFTGFASCTSGDWYIKNGMVDKESFGMINGTIDGETKEWPVIHGQVVEEAQYNMASKANDYSSDTQWMMMIDSTANRVGVFRGEQGNWEFVYYWVCSTGDTSDPETVTVKGEFEITDNRGYSFSDYDYTCYYYSGFYGAYLFHSTLYKRGTFEDLNASLGANASHGCVRLAIENAKWVFYNIPTGTKVLSY